MTSVSCSQLAVRHFTQQNHMCAQKKERKKIQKNMETLYGDEARHARTHARTLPHSQVQLVNEGGVKPFGQYLETCVLVALDRRGVTLLIKKRRQIKNEQIIKATLDIVDAVDLNMLARTEGGAAGRRSSFLRPHGGDSSIQRASASGRHPAADHCGPLPRTRPHPPRC